MQLQSFFPQDDAGNLLTGGTATVYLKGTETLATGLADAAGNPVANPVPAAASGRIQFRAPMGDYDVLLEAGAFSLQVEASFVEAGDLMPSVSDMQALRELDAVPESGIIYLKCHTTVGDGGHGEFRWVSGAAPGTHTDNNGTIIVPTGGDGSAAWLRELDGYVTPQMFGAVGDGVTDDYVALQKAFDATESPFIGSIRSPRKAYAVDTALEINASDVVVDFGFSEIKIITPQKELGLHKGIITVNGNRVSISRVKLDGNNDPDVNYGGEDRNAGVYVSPGTVGCNFKSIYAKNTSRQGLCVLGEDHYLEDIEVSNTARHNISFGDGSNQIAATKNVTIKNVRCYGGTDAAIEVNDGCEIITIDKFRFEGNFGVEPLTVVTHNRPGESNKNIKFKNGYINTNTAFGGFISATRDDPTLVVAGVSLEDIEMVTGQAGIRVGGNVYDLTLKKVKHTGTGAVPGAKPLLNLVAADFEIGKVTLEDCDADDQVITTLGSIARIKSVVAKNCTQKAGGSNNLDYVDYVDFEARVLSSTAGRIARVRYCDTVKLKLTATDVDFDGITGSVPAIEINEVKSIDLSFNAERSVFSGDSTSVIQVSGNVETIRIDKTNMSDCYRHMLVISSTTKELTIGSDVTINNANTSGVGGYSVNIVGATIDNVKVIGATLDDTRAAKLSGGGIRNNGTLGNVILMGNILYQAPVGNWPANAVIDGNIDTSV